MNDAHYPKKLSSATVNIAEARLCKTVCEVLMIFTVMRSNISDQDTLYNDYKEFPANFSTIILSMYIIFWT